MDADLVLEGGGVKGIGLVGAISVLEGAGYRFHRVAGTSAGSIVGALVAAGMSSADLEQLMRELDYNRFQDESFVDRFGMPGKGAELMLEKGIYEGNYLREWLDAQLTKLGKRTFGDLKIDDPNGSLPPERSYGLVVMTSDVSRGELVRLPWDYPTYGLDPDAQLVADAVRCSMSIPFFFRPVQLGSAAGGTTDEAVSGGAPVSAGPSWMVDGGMLSNFPVDVFDRTDGKPPRWPTFGIKLSARPESAQEQRFAVAGTFGLARAMLGTMTSWYDQMHIDDPLVLARTMFVDTTGVRATQFDIDQATQDRLYTNGRGAAEGFLQQWDFARYVQQCRAEPAS